MFPFILWVLYFNTGSGWEPTSTWLYLDDCLLAASVEISKSHTSNRTAAKHTDIPHCREKYLSKVEWLRHDGLPRMR